MLFHQMREHKDGGALRAAKLRTKLKFCPDFLVDFERGGFKVLYKTSFDHNFSRPARIELKFCTVAKLEELNNFCLDQNESYPWKKVRFRDLRLYLARARARARAPGPPELGASGPYPEGEGGSSRWRARFYFLLSKCKIYAKNHVFIKAKLIEFRLQFRHPPSLRSPIWSFFLPYKCTYIRKNNVFISANLIEFRLQFRHPLSFRSPIWWFILPWICYAYEKKHVFLKAKLIEFASTDALPPGFWSSLDLWKCHINA